MDAVYTWNLETFARCFTVYAGLQAVIAVLAAVAERHRTGAGQYVDVAMAATLMAVNERAHVDLGGLDLAGEPAVLGATESPFFKGPAGEEFALATSLVGSLTLRLYLAAMRRGDLAKDPRFANTAARRAHLPELRDVVQTWIRTFATLEELDAQLDEAKIAMGVVRGLDELARTEWAEYWGATQKVSDRRGGEYTLPDRPWRFSGGDLTPLGEPAFQGEHNRQVCAELGLNEAEVADLEARYALVRPAHGTAMAQPGK